MKITLFPPLSIHEIGQRDNQEDAIAQWDDHLFVLCDGMGGHEKGEVASQTVCQSLAAWFQKNVNPDEPFTDDQLREAIEFAYTELDKYADGSPKQMGTTLTLLYIGGSGVTAAHMGDSRIYHIRPDFGVLYQSRDHSLVFDLFQAGEITYEEMATYPQKNMVTRAMTPGEDNRMRPDIIHITDIQPDDYFYMCSDGMLEQMSNDELESIIASDSSDEKKRQQLIVATANNQDNHTAWLIHIKDVIKEKADEQLVNEELTAKCNALNIKPVMIQTESGDDSDVEVIDEEEGDVVLIPSSSPIKKKPSFSLFKLIIAAVMFIIIMIAAWVLFGGEDNKDKEKQEEIEQIMQRPLHSDLNKAATTIDSTKNYTDE